MGQSTQQVTPSHTMPEYFGDNFNNDLYEIEEKIRFHYARDDSYGFDLFNLYSWTKPWNKLSPYNSTRIGELYIVNEQTYAKLPVYALGGFIMVRVKYDELEQHFIAHGYVPPPQEERDEQLIWQSPSVTVYFVIEPKNAQPGDWRLANQLNEVFNRHLRSRLYDSYGHHLVSPFDENGNRIRPREAAGLRPFCCCS